MKVLVFLEQRDGKLKSSALEALTVANKIAGGKAADVAGILVGKDVSALAAKVKEYGTDTIFTVDAETFKLYNVLNYTAALQAASKEFSPDVILGAASPLGRDLFARIAARLDAGIITDLVDIDYTGGFAGGVKPLYAGKILADVRFSGTGVKVATIRPNVFAATKTSGAATVKSLTVAAADTGLKTLEIKKGKSDKPDLSEAAVIISGGRSMGNAENFQILHTCADVIGATVGASRAAVDAGYARHDMQVGQTGKTVNPQLYIACGISGAIQHMAGMRTSKVIVAINLDPEAPIFSIADYGIVGDLFQAVPIFTEKFKELLK
jgi:electron transfer flavoprotein alpha subunit